MTTPIYNTASRLCLLLAFAAMALTSCDNATDTELSNITFGANNTDSVALNKQSTRIVLLHGGTGKYQANIADSKVASISISKDTLRINGLLEGDTYATILSGDFKRFKLAVFANSLYVGLALVCGGNLKDASLGVPFGV